MKSATVAQVLEEHRRLLDAGYALVDVPLSTPYRFDYWRADGSHVVVEIEGASVRVVRETRAAVAR